jgi:hypothetical protein
MNPKLQNVLAVIIGWLTIACLGALLFPILKIGLSK